MMALVPSNEREMHDEFRTMKTLVLDQDQDNQSEASHLHINERTDTKSMGTFSFNHTDDTTIEQVYQFQRSNTIQQRQTDGRSLVSIGAAFNNRHQQIFNENLGIQLPLIETNRPRSSTKSSGTRQPSEPLDVLPLKHRRNPMSLQLSQFSDETKTVLVNSAERRTLISHTVYEAPRKPPDRLRRVISRESNDSSVPLNSQLHKGVLSRPMPTPELDSDRSNVFRLIIQNGITKDQTDEFLSYRQFYYSIWGNIVQIFRRLEKLFKDYLIPLALINGEKVAELAQAIEFERKPTLDELLNTVINRDEVEKLIRLPGRRFFGNNGKERAAIVIQSTWRGYFMYRMYRDFQRRRRAIHIIVSAWLRYSKPRKLREQLQMARVRQLNFFQNKQNLFRDQWKEMKTKRRVIVHVASLGLTKRIRRKITNLPIRENYQIGCLCELDDPNVDMIYVASMPVNGDILQYYNKLIDLRASVEQGNEQAMNSNKANERFVIIVPEALNRFPGHHMCLSTLLKYSPKALKQIKKLIDNRSAYLVTGISHIDDLYLCEYFNIPIYGCEPEISYLYSTKSGSKRIFQSSQVPIPYGVYDIYEERVLFESLARLIIDYNEIQRWIFKIDDHFDGLGIAYCDIVKHLSSLKLMSTILCELPDILSKYTIFVNKTQFHSWHSYLRVFLSQGGIIEAYPRSDSITTTTICLSIDPNGHYALVCSGDQIHAESEFSAWGLVFPQSAIDSTQLNTYCSLIVEQCRQRNIFGYIDIDFLVFLDQQTNNKQIWVSDLSIGYSENVSLFYVTKYLTTGEFQPETHSFIIKKKQAKQKLRNWQNGAPEYTITESKRYAIWSSKLYHENLSTIHYSIFFQICRSHGIGFDIRERQGSIFTLFECEQHRHLGMITISESSTKTLTNFISYLNAIHQEITNENTEKQSNFLLAVNNIEKLLGNSQQETSISNTNTSH